VLQIFVGDSLQMRETCCNILRVQQDVKKCNRKESYFENRFCLAKSIYLTGSVRNLYISGMENKRRENFF